MSFDWERVSSTAVEAIFPETFRFFFGSKE
jgi:hypothetical protein